MQSLNQTQFDRVTIEELHPQALQDQLDQGKDLTFKAEAKARNF